jgi:hypothetical protein
MAISYSQTMRSIATAEARLATLTEGTLAHALCLRKIETLYRSAALADKP